MSPRLRLWLLFGVLAAVTTAALVAVLWLVGAGTWMVAPALLLILAAQALVWLYLDQRWVRPGTALAREIELLVHARAARSMAAPGPHALGRLPEAVAALVERWRASEHRQDAAIEAAMARAGAQQSQLEALLRDLSDGVIACSLDRRILLFNDAALRILATPVELGLNRPLDALIAREPITHVLEALRQRHAAGPEVDPALRQEFVCATADGALLLRCRMAPIMGPDRAISGFIIDFSDAAPLAGATWPMADVFSSDLVHAVGHRLADDRPRLVAVGAGAWLQCDAWHLTLLLERLARRIAAQQGAHALDLEAHAQGARIMLDLIWPGESLATAALEPWLDEPLATGASVSLRDVLRRHASTPETGAGERAGLSRLRLPLAPPARPRIDAPALPALPPRPEFYDFEILARPEGHDGPLLGRPLAALDYVVFDTETTGLDPRHDRIVQLAGVRIVNRRLLSGEVFDALVNPGQPIARASIRFHGITDAMVVGRPPIEVVLPQFHRFARGAVLVAHNAAFDMAFLQRDASDAGVVFDQPVLDSLLLSAVLHDHEQRHTLDAIAARFGITLSDRHQALGDAIGTAQVFLRMLDLLQAAGIRTLGDALAASEKARALRREQRRQFGAPAGTEPR